MLIKSGLFSLEFGPHAILFFFERGQLFTQFLNSSLLFLHFDLEFSELILNALLNLSLSGLILGLHFGLFLRHGQQTLILVLDLSLEADNSRLENSQLLLQKA